MTYMTKKPAFRRIQSSLNSGMSIGALATYLGVGRERIYDMVKRGKIRTVQTSAGQIIPPSECDRIIASMITVTVPSGRERKVFEEV